MMVGRDVQFAVDKKPCEVGKPILEVEDLVVPSKVHKNNAVRGVSFTSARARSSALPVSTATARAS